MIVNVKTTKVQIKSLYVGLSAEGAHNRINLSLRIFASIPGPF